LKIGLITNPLSRANRQSGGVAARIAGDPRVSIAHPRNHDQLVSDLQRFARDGVDLIAIDGGDGTIRDVLSNIDSAYTRQWPSIALLPSGKTNVIAGQVGHFGPGYKGWQNLMAARKAGTLGAKAFPLRALEISRPNGDTSVQRGFLLGFAAFTDGVRMANEKIHPMGIAKGLAVAMVIGGILRRAVANSLKSGGYPGEAATVLVDDTPSNGSRHFLIVACTLDRLTLGLRPFWDQGTGPINWLDVAAPPKSTFWGVLNLAFGKRKTWMEKGGYAGGRAETLEVQCDAPFVLDGEVYPSHGHVRITTTQPIVFLSA
jgi:hypothetical protein